MKAQDLVIQGIETLSAMFSHISFKYGFDSTSNQHIIEIQPVSAYQTDDYIEAESGVILNFIRQFPDEGILFISNNTYIQVTDPIYIKYASISTKIGVFFLIQAIRNRCASEIHPMSQVGQPIIKLHFITVHGLIQIPTITV